MECILQDPRLDSQVESRSEYYASLFLEKGLPIRPLAQHLQNQNNLDESEQNTTLTVDTLGQLAIRGHQEAATTLYDYILWGQWQEVPLYEVLNNGSPELCQQIAEAIERRLPSDEALEEELAWFDLKQAPWTALARPGSRIAKLAAQPRKLKGLAKLQENSPPNLAALPISELLQIANKDNCHLARNAIVRVVTPADQQLLVSSVSADKPYQAEVALTGLACLAPPGLFGWLRDGWAVNPNIPPRLQYRARQVILEFPPELTLPVAREWLHHPEPEHRKLAEQLLECHATSDDIPLLRAAIAECLTDELTHCYRLCDLIEAFDHLPGVGEIPELKRAFVECCYSYGRGRAAQALSVSDPEAFTATFAHECLWDCQSRTRELGAQTAPMSCSATERLRFLSKDPLEDEEVREAACQRIAVTAL